MRQDAQDQKKDIREFWQKNAPGIHPVGPLHSPDTREFYTAVDSLRYTYEANVADIIGSFVREKSTVLEIGSGLGSDSRLMARAGARTVSMDLCFGNISMTLTGMRLLGLGGAGVCADAERLPFKDNTFDVVYSFGVLHHTPDTEAAIREAYRVLKKGGRCIVMLYHKGYAYYALLARDGWRRLFLRQSFERVTSRYDHTPLSKMYSKKQALRLFSLFGRADIEMTTYGGIQQHPWLKFVWKALHGSKFLMDRFGSFAVIRAVK